MICACIRQGTLTYERCCRGRPETELEMPRAAAFVYSTKLAMAWKMSFVAVCYFQNDS